MPERSPAKFDLQQAVAAFLYPQGFSENEHDRSCEHALIASELAVITVIAEQADLATLEGETQELVADIAKTSSSVAFQHLIVTKVARNVLAYQLVTNGNTPYLWKKSDC